MRAAEKPSGTDRGRALARTMVALAAALLGGGALGATPREDHERLRIELRPEVEVAAPRVTLGDVAILTTLDLPTLERLVALPLGPAPRAGTAISLERGTLLRWIRARTGISPDAIRWGGPDTTVVRAAMVTLSGEQVARTASEALVAAVGQNGLRAEVGAPLAPKDVEVPAGSLGLHARPIPRVTLLSQRPSVWVDVTVDGRFVRTVPVAFDLTVSGPAYVATAGRRAGEVLDAGSVGVQERAWSGLEALPVGPETLGRVRLKRSVQPGAAITRSQVEPVPLVRRGEPATLRAGRGLVSLESKVEVLEDGRSGDTVRVKPFAGEDSFLARVTGPDALEVEP